MKYETQLDNEAESFVNVIQQAAWNNIPDGKTEYSLWSATAKLNDQWYNNHPLETPMVLGQKITNRKRTDMVT